jgi:hypothetical protein
VFRSNLNVSKFLAIANMTEFKSFYASVIISVQQISGNENNKEIGL